jgi:acetone monooxygenase (methyl acetate-forming)
MAQEVTTEKATDGSQAPLKLDAAVVGVGVAGLYQLYLLRNQGLTVKAFDAAPDVGGTWYWNRYPGARFVR